MRRALRLARRGLGRVSPNPLVGAVVVSDDRVVGEGAHLQLGGPHAEVHALAAAGLASQMATMFVTLEPCPHQGRTPPCTDAVIEAGIRRVVCAMKDPDPEVSGGGISTLREAGLLVDVGLLRDSAERLNAPYLKHRRTGRPLVILKLGQSLDGRIATRGGQSRWITGEKARRHVHQWRRRVDAVFVGASTVEVDDPQLTVRLGSGSRHPGPRPVVVDGRLRLTPQARVFQHSGAILATSESSPPQRRGDFLDAGVEVWTFPDEDGRLDLRSVMDEAGRRGMTSVLVEGGGRLAASALKDQVVDRVMIYLAPRIIGEGIPAIGELDTRELADAVTLEQVRTRRLGDDLLYTADVRYACSQD